MRTANEIESLLGRLDSVDADSLEGQDLDFEEWDVRSLPQSMKTVIAAAICMANGGGGTVVLGIRDKVVGRTQAILGIPVDIDINRLRRAVYDSTDPKLTPEFAEINVQEGTGRVLVMQIYPGMRPYTDTSGKGTIRIGKECQPLTGSMRRRVMVETGQADYTRETVQGNPRDLVSPSAMEHLRKVALLEKAPDDLVGLSDPDLIAQIGVADANRLTRAALLLVGTENAIHANIPGYGWTYLRMKDDTQLRIG